MTLNSVKQTLGTEKLSFRCLNKIIGRVNHACIYVFLPLDKWNRKIKSLNKRILSPCLSPLIKERGVRRETVHWLDSVKYWHRCESFFLSKKAFEVIQLSEWKSWTDQKNETTEEKNLWK